MIEKGKQGAVAEWMDDPALCTKEKMESLITAYQIEDLLSQRGGFNKPPPSRAEVIAEFYSGQTSLEYRSGLIDFLSVPSPDVEALFLKELRQIIGWGRGWIAYDNLDFPKEVARHFTQQRQTLLERPNFKEMVEIYRWLLRKEREFAARYSNVARRPLGFSFQKGMIKATMSLPDKKRGNHILRSGQDLPKLKEMLQRCVAHLERKKVQQQIERLEEVIESNQQEILRLKKSLEERA